MVLRPARLHFGKTGTNEANHILSHVPVLCGGKVHSNVSTNLGLGNKAIPMAFIKG